ncbi:MAG: right-handed parallel beta-helix repeat-containing protein [Pseudomonadota bacterium]
MNVLSSMRIYMSYMMKCRLKAILYTTIIILGLTVDQKAFGDTLYMGQNETYKTLKQAFSAMKSGDTLIIKDGVYTGADNQINSSSSKYPPDGTANSYTIVKAENPGGVLFDGTDTGWIFIYYGNTGAGPMQYVKFDGIRWRNGGANKEDAVSLHGSDHVKFTRCGFYDAGSAGGGNSVCLGLSESSYILVEDSYAYGGGRYKFLAWHCNNIIFRRCVARFDWVCNELRPKAGWSIYGSDDVRVQNCIAIDGDTRSLWLNSDQADAAFYTPQGSGDEASNHVVWEGCIALNWDMPFSSVGGESAAGPVDYVNCVGWKVRSGDTLTRGYNTSYRHCTFGEFTNVSPPAFNGYGGGDNLLMQDSIFANINAEAIRYGTSSSDFARVDHNYFYNVAKYEAGTNAIESQNSFTSMVKYLTRVENGTDLDGAASDGGDVGATILKRIGVSGTMYGESGFDRVTDENLWPFPNEGLIRTHMRAYNLNGVNGARGFCSDNQTLTKYIWGYLGNPIPTDFNDAQSGITASSGDGSSSSDATDSGTNDSTPPVTTDSSSGDTNQQTDTEITQPSAGMMLQNFENNVLWTIGGNQDTSGNGRGWGIRYIGNGDGVGIDNIGANGTNRSLKVTFTSSNSPEIYFRADDKTKDKMPEAKGANRMSFYMRFPEDFPIQPNPFRYCTWQLGTYIHDPDNWNIIDAATTAEGPGIHHYYHRLTIEQVGNGWVKYIINTKPDQENITGNTVPPDMPYYFDNFGRFYFHFGPEAGGPTIPRPFSVWIDEIKFYYDDGSAGGQIHVGGQNDTGFNGEYIPDVQNSSTRPSPPVLKIVD